MSEQVTFYNSISETTYPKQVSLDKVLDGFKTGGKNRDLICDIAQQEDKKARAELKKKLPIICFNGLFGRRKIEGLLAHSGYIVLDIDDLEGKEAAIAKRDEVSKKPFVKAAFLSPSYKGIKFLVKIPKIEEDTPEKIDLKFKGYFNALQKVFPKLDPSGKDISRACFVSYDPDIYINDNPEEFTDFENVEKTGVKKADYEIPEIENSSLRDLQYLERKVYEANDGERHNVLLNISRLAGGFISAGRVTKDDAVLYLERGFTSRDYDANYDYKRTIEDGINYGLSYPKYKEDDYRETPHPDKKDPSSDGYDMYVPFPDFEEEAEDLYRNGNRRGLDGRFPVSREFMSYKIGFTTYIYSAPFSGKTQFAISELTYLAERYDWKIAVFSLEMGSPKDVLAEVASVYIGKLYNHSSKELKMTVQEKSKAIDFFKKHFYVLDPVHKKKDIEMTVDNILKEVRKIEDKEGVHINSVYIDPISELDDGGEERIHKFTHHVNKMVNKDARLYDRHNFLVSHVRDQQGILDKTENKTYYPMPTPRDVSGGQNTFKQGYQMVCVYRPPDFVMNKDTGDFYAENETHVDVQKAKPKGVGKKGKFTLYFDWKTNRYYEDKDCTVYSHAKEDDTQETLELKTEYAQPISKENADFPAHPFGEDEDEDEIF